MRFRLRRIRAVRAQASRLSILVLMLVSNVVYAVPLEPNLGGSGTVSYKLLAFLLAVNIAGVIRMRRWAATIESGEDKE